MQIHICPRAFLLIAEGESSMTFDLRDHWSWWLWKDLTAGSTSITCSHSPMDHLSLILVWDENKFTIHFFLTTIIRHEVIICLFIGEDQFIHTHTQFWSSFGKRWWIRACITCRRMVSTEIQLFLCWLPLWSLYATMSVSSCECVCVCLSFNAWCWSSSLIYVSWHVNLPYVAGQYQSMWTFLLSTNKSYFDV